ncbi:MAG TPA: hypothetical protein PKE25_14690, partial [Novosphingobium sp.]|nr:hypothetical protein [Novosphingobium sp.]
MPLLRGPRKPLPRLARPAVLPHDSPAMREWADFSLEADGRGTVTLAFSGPLRIWALGDIDLQLDGVTEAVDRIDLGGVSSIDTAGAWLAWRTASRTRAEIVGASDEARRLIAAVSRTRAGDEAEHPA